ncbi:MAG: MFS transporter [Bacteroidales bacterium]|nr:MFS transporter [Bacteroidales bacterium]
MSRLSSTFKKFPRAFWVANTMELFERWAWYGLFMVLAIYLTASKDTGALGFTQVQKGYLMGTVVAVLYFLPVITGAIADKYGYKKVLILSYIILSSGYLMMGIFKTYTSMWFVFLYLAVGAGLFKPVISATIAKTTNEKTASIGFGIFYMIVNIGAFIGPIFASKLREVDWFFVFVMSSVVIGINMILVIFFFKEPERKPNTETLGKSMVTIIKNIFSALKDVKLLLFLIIIIGFWTMYNQLFYTLPVFIEQWIDTSVIYNAIANISPALASAIGNDNGTISPEMLVNIDALYIVIFQIAVSTIVMKYKPLNTMISGFIICAIGIGLWFVTTNPFYLFLTIFIFGIGEMVSSPKILEYIGRIAPKDKVALYMGCYFLPMAGGNFFAGIISGDVYGRMSDKITLLRTEVETRGLNIPEISNNFTQNDFVNTAAAKLNMSIPELSNHLWNTYNPYDFWMVVTGIGMGTVVLLWLYDRFVLRDKG